MAATNEAKLVFGTSGNDVLTASAQGGQHVFAAGGDDILAAASKSNVLHGGEGSDSIAVTGSHNILYGEAGDDSLVVKSGENAVHGNGGNDILSVTGDSNLITGGNEDDFVLLNGSNNNVSLGSGQDSMELNPLWTSYEGYYGNKVDLGTGFDSFTARGFADSTLRGGEGWDTIVVHRGKHNRIDAESGDDTIEMSHNSSSTFIGGDGNDTMVNLVSRMSRTVSINNKFYGNDGYDVFGASGDGNFYFGGNGGDTFIVHEYSHLVGSVIKGEGGSDIIETQNSNNLWGIPGNEFDGGAGNDILTTGISNTTMLGGSGNDVLTVNDDDSQLLSGGQGQDEYVLNGTNLYLQWISDHGVKGEQDVVRLNGFSKDQLALSRDGGDLLIESEHMRLAVDRFFVNGGYRIERFELGDGTVWTDSDIEKIIQAMAAAPASGAAGDQAEEGSSAQELNLLLAAGGAPALI